MRFIGIEIRRILKRRAFRVLILVVLGIFALVAIIGVWKVHDLQPVRKITEADGPVTIKNQNSTITIQIKGKEATVKRVYGGSPYVSQLQGDQQLQEYNSESNETMPTLSDGSIAIYGNPGNEDLYQDTGSALARFADLRRKESPGSSTTGAVVALVIFVFFLTGATAIGADWKWNQYAVLLTWEPRRWKLFASRLLALFLLGLVTTAILIAVFAICTIPTVLKHGNFDGLTATWWKNSLLFLMRASFAGGLAAVVGGSLAMIARNTTAAIVASMVYIVVLQSVLAALVPRWWFFDFAQLIPSVVDWNKMQIPIGESDGLPTYITIHPEGALTTVVIAATIFFAVAFAAFKRRDISTS